MTFKLDRWDLALLRKLSDTDFVFAKRDDQESRLHDLSTAGLVFRVVRTYKRSAGGTKIEIRNAYRRTPEGKARAEAE